MTESLSEKLKQVGVESFETWFDRWYKKRDLEHLLIVSSSKGFNKLNLYLNNETEYIRNRMLDKKFIPKLKKMLGTGINVYLKVVPRKNLLGFGIADNYIVIEW